MTTRVELQHVSVVGANPDKFDAPIQLRVVLEVFEKVPQLPIDITFIYSPIWDFSVDQVLDELEVGPLQTLGKHEFVLQCDAPDVTRIPDPTGPTALLVRFTYRGEEFLHLGYHVIVTCEGDMPDTFTSAEQLTRLLAHCYPRQRVIAWDKDSDDDGADVDETDAHARETVPQPAATDVQDVASARDDTTSPAHDNVHDRDSDNARLSAHDAVVSKP